MPCRADALHSRVVRPRTPAERHGRAGRGSKFGSRRSRVPGGESPVLLRTKPPRKNASGEDRRQREYSPAFHFSRDFPTTALQETPTLSRAPLDCFVHSVLSLNNRSQALTFSSPTSSISLPLLKILLQDPLCACTCAFHGKKKKQTHALTSFLK